MLFTEQYSDKHFLFGSHHRYPICGKITNEKTSTPEQTIYRNSKVTQLENTVTHLREEDRNDYQNKMFGSRHTDVTHKHRKKLNKSSNFRLTKTLDSVKASTSIGKANLFNKKKSIEFPPQNKHKNWMQTNTLS